MTRISESTDDIARVNHVYRSYLDTTFYLEYYQERYRYDLRHTKHFDFFIGLGTAVSGGSGLGILADARFAWLCGILTTLSVVLSAAKNSYDWSGKLKETTEKIAEYSALRSRYGDLMEDIQFHRHWDAEFEQRYGKLREEKARLAPYSQPHWGEDKLRRIQDRIKARLKYQQWWEFRE